MVSVIIPAHNVERYIEVTLKSVLDQTFRDFEIIVVNDGSTDDTESVAKRVLKGGDIPFRVISQTNKGVSVARNMGMVYSKGRYIKFLDADDILKADGLGILVEVCEKNDLAFCFGKQDVVDRKGAKIYTYDQMYFVDWDFADYKTALKGFLMGLFHISCNTAIFRRDILEKYSLIFTPGARFGEDIEFVAKYIFFAKKIAFAKEVICDALLRFDSSTKTSNLLIFHNVASFKRLLRFFENLGEDEIVEILKEYSIPASYGWVVANLAYNSYPYRLWHGLLANDTIRKMLKRVKFRFTRRTKFHKQLQLAKFVYYLSPSLLYLTLNLIGKWHRRKHR